MSEYRGEIRGSWWDVLILGSLAAWIYLSSGCAAHHVDDSCARAGERLRELECRDERGRPLWRTPDGTSFEVACEDAKADGRDWNPDCLARIEGCSELEAAYRGSCR